MSALKSQLEVQMNEILNSLQTMGSTNNSHTTSIHTAFNGNQNRFTKIDFPKFNGENIEGWLCKVEHFFVIDSTPDNLKVRYAIVHLEDIALLWHQSFVQSRGGSIEGMSWGEYKGFINSRFAEVLGQDAMGALANLKQQGTLRDFCKQFDLALTKVTICDEYAVSLFLRAVKPEIGYPLRLLRPRNLPEAYLLARIQDESINVLQPTPIRTVKPAYSSFPASTNTKFSSGVTASNLPLLPSPPLKSKPTVARRLSHKEIEEKRAKGECFGCSEKYTPTHQCKNKQLFSIELVEEDDEEQQDDNDILQSIQEPYISLNAIMGVHSFSTMRVKGSIGTKPLHILIDSGSTHNFLNLDLALKMKCPVKPVATMNITIADGNKMPCTQLCENFQWIMQGNWFVTDVMLIPLTNYDMVLGVQWLQTLNDIVWNFKDLTMKFKVGNQQFELRGVGSKDMTLCSFQKMNHLLDDPLQLADVQLFSMQAVNVDSFQHETVIVIVDK
ncbi:hypothetical protein E3N88_40717 [Mikania micrantha]|uniref:Retrotransposon gag domain-containing protein n=1 Tax=Mikania micrantha TaxID=192012 RepID=A0A5N6LNC9_9ASTR|nr:hypothetical protein E3N88_40717 [Mikania micrantha]